ncbi:MAG: ATP-dependent DNA ligase, partial [Candidatus Eremiobacteraeota bacterium]|nr:ATP-dependent DNA ligase [Candidatus Eremiobacteraeota bacterium]
VESIPEGPGWLYEPKWDGFRCLAHKDGDDVALTSKAGQPLARYFPEIERALRALDANVALDGELGVPLAGALSFDALQQRIHPAASRIALLAERTPAVYLVFDLLQLESREYLNEGLETRREALEALANRFERGSPIRLSPATTSRSVVDDWFASVGGALDGIVAKKLGVPYASGRRDAAVKVKRMRSADCVVAGFRYAKDSTSSVGSLLLGLYDDAGLLDYIGFCSAFPAIERRALIDRLAPHIGEPGFTGGAPDTAPSRWQRDDSRDRSYVKLDHALVLEVQFDQVTGGRIRHGTRPLRWRGDKSPRTCTIDQLESPAALTTLFGGAPIDQTR